jgi:hypothetical protein
MPRVLTVCPTTGQTVPTEAVMTVEAFRRLKVGMAIYCPACGRSHHAERHSLWLEGVDPPPVGRSREDTSSELTVERQDGIGRGAP